MMMNYQEYYDYCRDVAKVSDIKNFPDLEINNPLILDSIENYNKKVLSIQKIITEDVHGWDNSDPLFVNYNHIQTIPDVISLGDEFCNTLSQNFFGCQVVFDRVECYKNKVSTSSEHSSWKWHYDDCAPYRYKIMIYLSDVDVNSGGMKVLLSPTGECISYKSSRVKLGQKKSSMYEGSRIPESVINEHIKSGYVPTEITGVVGTTLFFHQNIAHKATIPTQEPTRTCVIYNFRPYHKLLNGSCFLGRTDGSNTGGVKDYSTSLE